MTEAERVRILERSLRDVSDDINRDQYMLMEYLIPVIDGCRAALRVDVSKASNLHKLQDSEFREYIDGIEQSFNALTICFRAKDTGEICSIVFEEGQSTVFDECVEPDVVVVCDSAILLDLLDPDSQALPTDVLGSKVQVSGNESQEVLEALGFLCFTPLLRMARSGIDPSSLLAEDADSMIMAAASDLVTKMVGKWISSQLGQSSDTTTDAPKSVKQGHGRGRRAP